MNRDERLKKILGVLYERYKKSPSAAVGPEDLLREAGGPATFPDFQSEITYLSNRGFIEGVSIKTFGGHPQPTYVRITPLGVAVLNQDSLLSHKAPEVELDIAVRKFLVNLQQAIENADIPEEERKELLAKLNEFASHPVVSGILSSQLAELLKSWSQRVS